MPRQLHMLTEPMTAAERAESKRERDEWNAMEKRIAELETALREISERASATLDDPKASGRSTLRAIVNRVSAALVASAS